MSTMFDAVSASMSDLWDFAADAGTYTPPVGDPVACQVRIDRQAITEPDGLDTVITGEEIRAKVLIAEIGEIPVARTPNQAGGVFSVDSEDFDFEVTETLEKDNHFFVCAVREIDA